MRHTVWGAVLLLAAAVLALPCAPQVAQAAQETATIVAKVRVFQEYKVQTSGLQNTFAYVIEPVESDAPLPVDANGKAYSSFKLAREDDLWLEFPVEVSVDPSATPYEYHYVIKPKEEELPDGLYYVDVLSPTLEPGVNEYPLEIHVQPSSVDAAVSIVVPTVHNAEFDGPKIADPGWRVGYAEPGDEPGDEPEDEPGDNPSDKPNAEPSDESQGEKNDGAGASAAGAASGGTVASTSGSAPLSTTADVLAPAYVIACVACAGALLLGCACLRCRKAGEEDA